MQRRGNPAGTVRPAAVRSDTVAGANCIPCRMPYITSMFMPRSRGDRPLPVPRGAKNLAFVSQFVEIPDDVVFTVEYSVRAAQTAVYELFGVDRKIPAITPHDKSLRVAVRGAAEGVQVNSLHPGKSASRSCPPWRRFRALRCILMLPAFLTSSCTTPRQLHLSLGRLCKDPVPLLPYLEIGSN